MPTVPHPDDHDATLDAARDVLAAMAPPTR